MERETQRETERVCVYVCVYCKDCSDGRGADQVVNE